MNYSILKRFAELSCGKLMNLGIFPGTLHTGNNGATYTGDVLLRVPHGRMKFTFVAGVLGSQERLEVDSNILCHSLREVLAYVEGISDSFRIAVFPDGQRHSETYALEIYFRGGDPNDVEMLKNEFKAVLSLNLLPEHYNMNVVTDPLYPFAKCSIEDLWALVYDPNNPEFYEVVKAYHPLVVNNDVFINPRKRTWVRTNECCQDYLWEHQIGIGFYQRRGSRKGVIGIYDRTNASQMRSMIRDGISAIE